ncbi:MAG: hypothetical protein ACRCU1_03410 [Alsobacter sp.]
MGTKLVKVRALPRPGFKAFFRGGHRWPEEGRVVRVSEELFDVLSKEIMLAKEMPAEGESPEAGVLEYDDNRNDDRAHNASHAQRMENERLKAEKAVLDSAGENERLRAEVEELRLKLSAKAEKKQQQGK